MVRTLTWDVGTLTEELRKVGVYSGDQGDRCFNCVRLNGKVVEQEKQNKLSWNYSK